MQRGLYSNQKIAEQEVLVEHWREEVEGELGDTIITMSTIVRRFLRTDLEEVTHHRFHDDVKLRQ